MHQTTLMYRCHMPTRDRPPVPEFVRLAGHDLRWRLLHELAHSDRRVRELVTAIDEPQNLISYHLGKLRGAGLVTIRRSSADRRDVYYHLDLTRCARFLAGAAVALHPGLAHERIPTPRLVWPVRVLFLCTGNSARSPMAAALLRHRAGSRVEVLSAGSDPKPLHPHAIRALGGYGIDLTGHRPRHLTTYAHRRFDYVISLCDRLREVCPEFPHSPDLIHWSIANPTDADTEDAGTPAAFRRTAAELDTRIQFLIAVLNDPTQHRREPQ